MRICKLLMFLNAGVMSARALLPGNAVAGTAVSRSTWAGEQRGARGGRVTTRMVITTRNVPPPDLYIVGCGYLGTMIAKEWKYMFPNGNLEAETRTPERHDYLQTLGVKPHLRESRDTSKQHPNVIFCAAPSGNEDYAGEIAAAAELWDGTGAFVFSSSSGVYAEDNGGTVREDSPVSENPRYKKILDAEAKVLELGGCVVRLAGLYAVERGAHNFWINAGKVAADPNGLISLLAYDDASECMIAAVEAGQRSKTYLASDDTPMSRIDICRAALKHPFYLGQKLPTFATPEELAAAPVDAKGKPAGSKGKICDGTVTRRALKWFPSYSSFDEYIDCMIWSFNANLKREEEAAEDARKAKEEQMGEELVKADYVGYITD